MHGSTTYNWSQNADVQELTRLFTAIANTLDYGRKLAFEYRFDKLGLDARLKELEDLRANHYAEELNAIEPILRKIADDPNMMHISRQTAQQLLGALNAGWPKAERPRSSALARGHKVSLLSILHNFASNWCLIRS